MSAIHLYLLGRFEYFAFFATSSGMLGVGPPSTLPGDIIASANNSRLFLLLRRVGEGPEHEFVGLAHVGSPISGRLLEAFWQQEGERPEEIVLI